MCISSVQPINVKQDLVHGPPTLGESMMNASCFSVSNFILPRSDAIVHTADDIKGVSTLSKPKMLGSEERVGPRGSSAPPFSPSIEDVVAFGGIADPASS